MYGWSGGLDPLTDAIDEAKQRAGSAGLWMLALLAGVGFLVFRRRK